MPSGDGRRFIYSPHFGRTYLFADELTNIPSLPILLGLSASSHCDDLPDPASCAHPVAAAEMAPAVGWFLPRLYLTFHRHRTISAIGRSLSLARRLAGMQRRRDWCAHEIGGLVMAVEGAAGMSDCYPRALLTACLWHARET